MGFLDKVFKPISSVFNGVVVHPLDNITSGIGDMFSGVGSGVSSVGTGIGSGVSNLGSGVGIGVSNLGSGVGSGVSSFGSGMGSIGIYIALGVAGLFIVSRML